MNFNLQNLNQKMVIYIVSAVAVVVILIGGYFLYQKLNKPAVPQTAQAQQEEVKRLVSEVGKLIELPAGETPTVATVTDVSKLKDQPFFAHAKNGDKVLIFANARKAILYDPNAKKVIDVAPINVGTSSAQVATPSATPK